MTTLIFVYNIDSGLRHTLADIGRRIFSPQTCQCALRRLSFGYFRERAAWRSFVTQLPFEARFLDRDRFHQAFPQVDVPLPAVFLQQEGSLRLCVSARSLRDCRNLEDLEALIRLACEQAGHG